MDKVIKTDFHKNIFRKDITGDVVIGGYPLTEIISKSNKDHVKLGGTNEVSLSRFEGLVVPLGLNVSTISGGCNDISRIKVNNSNSTIDTSVFDNLFEMVSHNNKSAKTRKLKIKGNTSRKKI